MNSKTSPIFQSSSVSAEDGDDLVRMLRFGTLGWMPPTEGAVFAPLPHEDFEAAWTRWLPGVVARDLALHILIVRPLGEEMRALEILRESEKLDPLLDDQAALRSRTAGASLLRVLASARHARLAERVAALLEGNDGDGLHLATAVGLQSVLFNLPPFSALLGYAFAEWRAARLARGLSAPRADAERFLAESPRAGEWAGGLLRASLTSSPRASFG